MILWQNHAFTSSIENGKGKSLILSQAGCLSMTAVVKLIKIFLSTKPRGDNNGAH